jgi:hypothetical protein
MSEEHRAALDKANGERDGYEETKRLVEAQNQLVTTKQQLDKVKAAYAELFADCQAARTSLLSELLDDVGNNSAETASYLEAVGNDRQNLLTLAAEGAEKKEGEEESSVARKARKAIDCGQKNPKSRTLDPSNYQFVKIGELVRLRVDKKERECQRVIAEVKASSGNGGNGRIALSGASTSTGLMSATRARIPDSSSELAKTGGEEDGEGGFSEPKDATAMVMQLERELESMNAKNKKLEQRCNALERELQNALGAADDLVVLKSKAIQLLVRV